jgi:uncharacterized protein with ParB-like and HNH nuclease domain
MKADKLTLERVFDRTERLEAPLFQRPYVWKEEENWVPLWEAIETIAEKKFENRHTRPHFLGTIVLDQLKTQTGNIHARQIIDGQQRLTTLQILLAAVRDLSTGYNQTRYADTFRKLTDNQFPLSNDPDVIFKVWPTNADRDDFRDVMRAGSIEAVRNLPHSNSEDEYLVPDAYLWFAEKIKLWLLAKGHEQLALRLDVFYTTLREDLLLVVIDLEQSDDAQEIFETLNALGTPLLPADLIKNYLFHIAEGQNVDMSGLYAKYWLAFDQDKSYWRKETRQGRLKRPRLDHYVGHYLVLKTGTDVIFTQLFSSFKDYVESSEVHLASTFMEDFKSYANVYQSFDDFPEDTREGTFFWRLDQLDTTTVYPLLLEIFKNRATAKDNTEIINIMTDIESFFVRRAVCDLTPKNYNQVFTSLIRSLRDGGEFTAQAIRRWLLDQTAETSMWPNDQQFFDAWMSLKFYKRLKKTRTNMILEAIEDAMRTGKTEKMKLEHNLTLEHLLPREWEKHWPLVPDGKATVDELRQRRQEVLHRIGNLTLLTKELNPSISNGPWVKKREQILKHSALNINRIFQNEEEWNENKIEKRSQTLFEYAIKVWPYPA